MPATMQQTQPLRDKVQGVINLIRPAVQADGGDLELVAVSPTGVVQIRFHGACQGCPSANMGTLDFVEGFLKDELDPSIKVLPL